MVALDMTTAGWVKSWVNDSEMVHIEPIEDDAQAEEILSTTKVIMTIIGTVANLACLFFLSKSAAAFSPVYLYLLKLQSVIDFFVCLCGTILVLQKPGWTTGNFVFDTIICQLWHGQFTYWTLVFYSIWNLVIVGYERFLAICKPFSHVDFSPSRVHKLLVLLVFVGIFANSPGALQIKMEDGMCASKFLIPGEAGKKFFSFVGIWFFIVYYSGPTIIFSFLYGKVTATLIKRRDESSLGESQLVNSAAKQMTQTAMAVTGIFILTMSWDFWYYLLGRVGLVVYIKNSLLQKIGVWLSAVNSMANPFVYFVLLPAFRRSTTKLFCPCLSGKAVGAGGASVNRGNSTGNADSGKAVGAGGVAGDPGTSTGNAK